MFTVAVSVSDLGFYGEVEKEWQSTIYNNAFLDESAVTRYIHSFLDSLVDFVNKRYRNPEFVFVYDGLDGMTRELFEESDIGEYLVSVGCNVKRRGIVTGLHDMKFEIWDETEHLCDFFFDVVCVEDRVVLTV